jgi:hypothetical protein
MARHSDARQVNGSLDMRLLAGDREQPCFAEGYGNRI